MSYRYRFRLPSLHHVFIAFLALSILTCCVSTSYLDAAHRRASVYVDALVSRYGSRDKHTLSAEGIQKLVDRIEFGQGKHCHGDNSKNEDCTIFFSDEEEEITKDEIGRETALESGPGQPSSLGKLCNESQFLCAATKSQNISYLLRLLGKRDNLTFNKTEFEAILPALVYRFQSDVYVIHHYETQNKVRPTMGQAFLYGFVFSTLVNLVSMVGIVLLPCMKADEFMTGLQFLVAMGAGSLFGTAVLILIPHSIELDISQGYLPLIVVLSAMVHLLYMLENMTRFLLGKRKEKSYEVERNIQPMIERPGFHGGHGHSHVGDISNAFSSEEINFSNTVSSVGWMVIFGDALHNFLDGVSIGAAFTVSVMSGISISLAVICEEFPHELADVAILIHSGLKIKKAFLYNFLAALACYVGMVVGIFLGELTNAAPWIFALAGGLFLYISLAVVIPEMRFTANSKKNCTIPVLHGCGLFIGYGIILILALFGENITVI